MVGEYQTTHQTQTEASQAALAQFYETVKAEKFCCVFFTVDEKGTVHQRFTTFNFPHSANMAALNLLKAEFVRLMQPPPVEPLPLAVHVMDRNVNPIDNEAPAHHPV